MTAARNRRMKTCGAIRTTFALCQCWPGQPGREDAWRCHARGATTWRIVTIILHYVMVKTEVFLRVMTRRRGEQKNPCRCSRLSIPTSRSRMTTRGNSRWKHTTNWLSINDSRHSGKFTSHWMAWNISRFYFANDTSLETESYLSRHSTRK